MRRHLFYLFMITLAPAAFAQASDISQKTLPNWPTSYPITGNVTVANFPATQPISGTVGVSSIPAITGSVSVLNFPAPPDVQPVSGTVAISNQLQVSISSVTTVPAAAVTSTMTASVSITTASIQILGANAKRKGLVLYNNSANSCYIAYDSFVNSNTHMTFLITTFNSWVMPQPLWLGPISVIRNAGTGSILITEMQ